MADPVLQDGDAIPVLQATPGNLNWRAFGTWIQAAGVIVLTIIGWIVQNQVAISAVVPARYAVTAATIFAIGKIIEGIQHSKDAMKPNPKANLS